MPGILYHLSFAEEVYRKLGTVIQFDKVDFMSGNLIPDLATDKKKSHYRKKASVNGFFVPEMELVKKDLLYRSKDSIKFDTCVTDIFSNSLIVLFVRKQY